MKIGRGNQIEELRARAGQLLPEVKYEFDLHGGDVRNFPLDRYTSLLTLTATQSAADEGDKGELLTPIHMTAWEAAPGFNVKAVITPSSSGVRVEILVSRIGAASFFSLAIYGAMLVMMACSLIVGSLVFLAVRKIEATLVSALGAIIFALPAMRNAMPGAPPLGVRADVLVFFWAELEAVIGLCLFIAAWAREGAKP